MLRISRYLLLVWLTFHIQGANANDNHKECESPLKLSITTDWYPYINRVKSQVTGLDVELLRSILEKMNCQLRVEQFPERRSLFELTNSQFDIGLGASKTAKRERSFHFSLPYRIERNRFAYKSSEKSIQEATGLQEIIRLKKIIAINLAGFYGDEIDRAKHEYNGFIFSDTAPNRMKMLTLGRVDIVIDDDMVLCSEIERANYNNIFVHSVVLSTANIHFIFNKKTVSSDFLTTFNTVLNSMIENGEAAALYNNYISNHCASQFSE